MDGATDCVALSRPTLMDGATECVALSRPTVMDGATERAAGPDFKWWGYNEISAAEAVGVPDAVGVPPPCDNPRPEFKWWDYNGRLKTANGVRPWEGPTLPGSPPPWFSIFDGLHAWPDRSG